eukprot:2747255-Rhodomonas_salina.1
MQGCGGIDATQSTHGSDTRLKRPATQAAPSGGALQPLKHSKLATGSTTYGKPLFNWWDCKTFNIDVSTDSQLAEYLIGHLITLQFPADYWPEEGGVTQARLSTLQTQPTLTPSSTIGNASSST